MSDKRYMIESSIASRYYCGVDGGGYSIWGNSVEKAFVMTFAEVNSIMESTGWKSRAEFKVTDINNLCERKDYVIKTVTDKYWTKYGVSRWTNKYYEAYRLTLEEATLTMKEYLWIDNQNYYDVIRMEKNPFWDDEDDSSYEFREIVIVV